MHDHIHSLRVSYLTVSFMFHLFRSRLISEYGHIKMSTNISHLAPKQIYSDAVFEESSSAPGKKVGGNREKAKQWTYYIETLNRTIDCIYEICHKEQTVNGCKVHDFLLEIFI